MENVPKITVQKSIPRPSTSLRSLLSRSKKPNKRVSHRNYASRLPPILQKPNEYLSKVLLEQNNSIHDPQMESILQEIDLICKECQRFSRSTSHQKQDPIQNPKFRPRKVPVIPKQIKPYSQKRSFFNNRKSTGDFSGIFQQSMFLKKDCLGVQSMRKFKLINK